MLRLELQLSVPAAAHEAAQHKQHQSMQATTRSELGITSIAYAAGPPKQPSTCRNADLAVTMSG